MNKTLLDAVQLVANLATALALVLVVIEAYYALRSYWEDLRQRRIDHALTFVVRWNSMDFNLIRREVHVFLEEKSTRSAEYSQLHVLVHSNKEIRGHVHYILNYFDELGLAVDAGVADPDLIYRYFHSIVTFWRTEIWGYVITHKSKVKDKSLWRDARKLAYWVKKVSPRDMSGKFWGIRYQTSIPKQLSAVQRPGSKSAPPKLAEKEASE